jgi:hypothetical protein
MSANAILGAGQVQLNMYNPSTQAYLGFGDRLGADRFEVTPDSEVKEKSSKAVENYGQAIASVVVAKPTKIAIIISAADREALAMQFQGTLARFSQGAGSIAGTVVARLDKWVPLSKRQVTAAGFSVSDGSTPYVLGTDYEVDYANGQIKALSSGGIEQAETLTIAGTALAVSGDRIRGGTQVQVRCQARFIGENMVDGGPMRVEVREAVLRSTQGFDFLAEDFNGIQLEGTLVTPAGFTEAYTVDFDDATA